MPPAPREECRGAWLSIRSRVAPGKLLCGRWRGYGSGRSRLCGQYAGLDRALQKSLLAQPMEPRLVSVNCRHGNRFRVAHMWYVVGCNHLTEADVPAALPDSLAASPGHRTPFSQEFRPSAAGQIVLDGPFSMIENQPVCLKRLPHRKISCSGHSPSFDIKDTIQVMANHASALKRTRQTETKTTANKANKSRVRSALRGLRSALAEGDAT